MADPNYGKTNFIPGFRLIDGTALNRALGRIFQGGLSRQDSITAFAGGGRTSATQLIKSLNRITVVATAGDSVALPKAIAGSLVWVTNADAADSLNIFTKASTSDTINGSAATVAYALAAGKTAVFICNTVGAWTAVTFP